MKPGRELDALVAEKVMGLKHIYNADPTEGWVDIDTVCHSLPNYSTDIAAAWQVVEKLKQLPWDRSYVDSPGVDVRLEWSSGQKRWECRVGTSDFIIEWADTLPLAICLAAVEAVGHK